VRFLKKIVGKKGGGGEVFIEPLGGMRVIILRSVENLCDVLGLLQGQFKTP
jgi:hypothetical protein